MVTLEEILIKAKDDVFSNNHHFDNTGTKNTLKGWFDEHRVAFTSKGLAKARQMVIAAEVHVQCAGNFASLMIENGTRVRKTPRKRGINAALRVPMSFTTMMCNHEMVVFSILNRSAKTPRYRYINAREMSTRYYVNDRDPGPFLKCEAFIMADLGLWTIVDPVSQGMEYEIHEGPHLLPYMELLYWPCVEEFENRSRDLLNGAEHI